jgi:acyl carrier protein/thioesterase domain-containing protein
MAQDMAGAWYGRQGVPIRRINWGFWGEVGRVANPQYRQRLRGTKAGAIETEAGLDSLFAILAAGVSDVAVLRLAAEDPPGETVPAVPQVANVPADTIRDRLGAIIAEALYLDAPPDPDANLVELGVDSILAVEIARRLQEGFGVVLPATRLYDAPTIRGLAAVIADMAAPLPEATPLPAAPPQRADADGVLARLVGLLADVFYLTPEAIDPDQPFTEMGLDSILAVELARRVEQEFGIEMRATRLYDQPTPRGLAALIAEPAGQSPAEAASRGSAEAVPVQREGDGPAGFWVPSFIGEDGWVRHLAGLIGEARPSWVLRPGDVATAASLAEVAASMAAAVRAAAPTGRVLLGGYSYGGVLAFEVASLLVRDGVAVERLVLLDSYAPGSGVLQAALDAPEPPGLAESFAAMLARGWRQAAPLAPVPAAPAEAERMELLAEAVRAACADAPPAAEIAALIRQNLAVVRRLRVLLRDHVPDAAARRLPVTLLRATRAPAPAVDPDAAAAFGGDGPADHGWSRWLDMPAHVIPVEADHFGLGEPAVLAKVAALLAPSHPPGGTDTEAARRRASVLEVVRRHTLAVLDGLAPEAVTLDISLRELGANSIDRVEIATLAMEELDADIPRGRLAGVANLASLVDLLAEYAAAP